MYRKITLGAAITLAIMFSTVTFITTWIYSAKSFNSTLFNIRERETMYAKIKEVDDLVRQQYYNTIDEDFLGESLVRGYVAGIEDPYASYLTAEQYAETQSDFAGRMVDIGVVCSQSPDGYIHIDQVYEDSPAALSELQAGDLIVKVDDLNVSTENYLEATDALRGEPGTTVTLLVRRDNVDKSHTVTRRRVEVPTVSGRMIGDAGYIRITEFNDATPDQFQNTLDELLNSGAKSLVFDVRNNPGGTIDSVGKILDVLLPEGPIVSATYRNSTEPQVLLTSDANEIDLPMAVLINGKSASDAELFAQALKDYNKAKAVGTTTYGKGSMQEVHKLSDGSALVFTVALYNPPTSPNFEGIGVKPDYEVRMSAELEKQLENLDENSDPQLKKALEVVAGLVKDLAPVEESDRPSGTQAPTEESSTEAPLEEEPEPSEEDSSDDLEEEDLTEEETQEDSSEESDDETPSDDDESESAA
ncbi:MAG: carboxyl-terminal protease [Oscillospiraceae bacterium]|nr:MAG: carboxyl-terminal protease [Oscillospiraceae bacterium]